MKTIRFESEQDFSNKGMIARGLVQRECIFSITREVLMSLGVETSMRVQRAMERAAESYLTHEPLSQAFQIADGVHRIVIEMTESRARSLLVFDEERDYPGFWREIAE